MNKILFLLVVTVTANTVNAQKGTNPSVELEKYFSEAIKKNNYYINKQTLGEISANKLIKTSQQYVVSPDEYIRYRAIDLLARKGVLETSLPERQKIVEILVGSIKDKDGGNSGMASKSLMLFNLNDFSIKAQDSLIVILNRKPFHFENVIKLIGFTNNLKATEALKNLKSGNSKINKTEEWAINLALARLGDEESITYCLNKVQSVPVNDNSVYYLFPDLVYTRQKVCIDYILNEILSDEKKCTSSNPDSEKSIICAFKIIELIAPAIMDFPVKVTGYGELETDDYDKALEEVRMWIKREPEYLIDRSVF